MAWCWKDYNIQHVNICRQQAGQLLTLGYDVYLWSSLACLASHVSPFVLYRLPLRNGASRCVMKREYRKYS